MKKIITINFISQLWIAVSGLIFIPYYISILGVEAYGVISYFTMFIIWVNIFEFGITPTLNREMASYSAGGYSCHSICELLYSMEIVCLILATGIGISFFYISNYMLDGLVKTVQISTLEISASLTSISLVIALRFFENIYRGSLLGLEKQISYSLINATMSTVRHGGALLVISEISSTIELFFIWQALVSIISVFILKMILHRAMPKTNVNINFSFDSIKKVLKFTKGIAVYGILDLLFSQIDRLFLSNNLTMEQFGNYTIALTIAGSIVMIAIPITQLVYTRMIGFVVSGDIKELYKLYFRASQVITLIISPAVLINHFYAKEIIFIWTGNIDIANNVAPILSILVLSTFFSVLIQIPLHIQFAFGKLKILIINILIVMILIIPIFKLINPIYETKGIIWVLILFNLTLLFLNIIYVQKKIFVMEIKSFLINCLFVPFGLIFFIFSIADFFKPITIVSRYEWALFLFATLIFALSISGVFLLLTNTYKFILKSDSSK